MSHPTPITIQYQADLNLSLVTIYHNRKIIVIKLSNQDLISLIRQAQEARNVSQHKIKSSSVDLLHPHLRMNHIRKTTPNSETTKTTEKSVIISAKLYNSLLQLQRRYERLRTANRLLKHDLAVKKCKEPTTANKKRQSDMLKWKLPKLTSFLHNRRNK